MQHFKIIKIDGEEYPDVLIYRDRNDDGFEIVKIMAFGIINDEENMMAEEVVDFDSHILACQYIEDFSLKSAIIWCKNNDIEYWKYEK